MQWKIRAKSEPLEEGMLAVVSLKVDTQRHWGFGASKENERVRLTRFITPLIVHIAQIHHVNANMSTPRAI
jgi:hypothetical protein